MEEEEEGEERGKRTRALGEFSYQWFVHVSTHFRTKGVESSSGRMSLLKNYENTRNRLKCNSFAAQEVDDICMERSHPTVTTSVAFA